MKSVIFFVLFYNVHKENMFTIEIEDGRKSPKSLVYINFACLSVCLYPINVKTVEPIEPKFYMATLLTLGKVCE